MLVSSTVRDLVAGSGHLVAGSGLVPDDRGAHDLEGVPEEWRLYELVVP